ncbi:sensor histidine kinase [Micromonospora sp. DR5-3]|uniref:sensor histidine kinase n=1 Tax=unclassified Micromonospora TaxID=2617518 RepID=UPI0021042A00|nr:MULTISPECIES: sensor histidine kinase [unclassified Micromonospora]MCW3820471.1 sensor histidine kinase [Micromonospora sp. DR5-3]
MGGPVLRRWMVDAGITLAVLVAAEIAIATGSEDGAVDRDWFAYLLGVALAAPLLLRRRYPTAVLYAVSAALLLFYALDYPGFPPALVLAVPLYDVTRAGRLWWAMPVPVFFLTVGAVVLIAHREMPPLNLLAAFLPQATTLAVAMLLAALMRSRTAYAAEVRHRLDQAERERELEARRLVTEERLRIARDLHDTVGHAIATITVQSAAALRLLDAEPERTREALLNIRGTGKAALAEMRATLGQLRSDDRPGPAGPDLRGTRPVKRDTGLHRLPELLAAVRAAGLPVELHSELSGEPLPAALDEVAYRIVQESLTNVLRHAGAAACAEVLLRAVPDSLWVEVRDDGAGTDAGGTPSGGRGLTGMRERAEALSGRFEAGPRPGGGFQVRAVLPWESPKPGPAAPVTGSQRQAREGELT